MASTGEAAWRLGHRPALDGVRGIAILLVLAGHTGYLADPVGAIGVAVFFVLSGFLVTRVILEAQARGDWSLRVFLSNRAARLYPALLLVVVGISGLWIAAGQPASHVAGLAALPLLYLQNFTGGALAWTPFDHTWSLAVEEQFYLLLPLVLPFVLRRRHPVVWLLAAAVGSAALRLAFAPSGWSYMSLPTNGAGLLAGCALAVAAPRLRSAPLATVPATLGLLGGLAFITPATWLAPYVVHVVTVPIAVALTWGAVAGDPILAGSWLRFVGRVSYALYLWHFPLLVLTGTQHTRGHALPVVVVAFALAVASTLLVEEPVRRAWRSRPGYATPVTRRRYSNDAMPAVAVPHEDAHSPA